MLGPIEIQIHRKCSCRAGCVGPVDDPQICAVCRGVGYVTGYMPFKEAVQMAHEEAVREVHNAARS
jgi:hypothetical protein